MKRVIEIEVDLDEGDKIAIDDLKELFDLPQIVAGLLNDGRAPGEVTGKVRGRLAGGEWGDWVKA